LIYAGPYDQTEYDNATKKFFADRTQQGGNPHERTSVKNAGGGMSNVSHPLSSKSYDLIYNDPGYKNRKR